MQPLVGGLLLEIDPAVVTRFLRFDPQRTLLGVPKKMTARTFDNKRYFGVVIADKALKPGRPLEKCSHVKAMYQRFTEGLDWDKTEYVSLYDKRYKKEISRGGVAGGFDFFAKKKLQKYDAIFEDIKLNGYRQSASVEENIEVALDANGEVLLIDGRHRLILAKLIGLKKVPVVVNLVAESLARSFVDNSDNLKSQLQEESVDQRIGALSTVPGGRKNKGVLVSAFQRNYFPD